MSENKTNRLLGSITNISDDRIEEAQSATAQKKASAWMKWTAMVACFCLIAVGIFTAIGGKDPSDRVIISAEDLVWTTGAGSAGTTNYSIRRFDEEKGIPVSPVKDNTDAEKLSVYRSLNARNSNETYELLLSWAEDLVQRAKDNLGIDLNYNREVENILMDGERYHSDAPLSDLYMYYLSTKLSYEDAVLTLSCVSEGNITHYDLDGIQTLYEALAQGSFPPLENPTAEEVFAAAEPIAAFVNQLTGMNYTLSSTSFSPSEGLDGLFDIVHFRSPPIMGNELSTQMFQQRGSLCVRLLCDENGKYQLNRVSIFDVYYQYIGEYELISLSEAEAYLHKGYTFGGIQCPVCKANANNPAVDFSEYDLVQIEYLAYPMEYSLPYYAFYKQIGTGKYPDSGESYEDYAVTYVPAIKVDGLKKYFRAQETQHEKAGHSIQ